MGEHGGQNYYSALNHNVSCQGILRLQGRNMLQARHVLTSSLSLSTLPPP